MRRKQKTDFYFASFSKAIEFSRQEALMLYDVLQGFQPENLPKVMEEMHKLENSADISKHEMMEKLAQEFITPIERDDIAHLAQELDEITDHIEDIILRMYMFNIQSIREEAFDFAKVIIGCCEQLKTALADFDNYKKSKIIPQAIIEINRGISFTQRRSAPCSLPVRTLSRFSPGQRPSATRSAAATPVSTPPM